MGDAEPRFPLLRSWFTAAPEFLDVLTRISYQLRAALNWKILRIGRDSVGVHQKFISWLQNTRRVSLAGIAHPCDCLDFVSD